MFIGQALIGDGWITNAMIRDLDATKVTFGQMQGERIAVETLNADRIWTPSLTVKLAHIQDAYINRANIHWASVDSLRIAGQSATIGSTFSHGGMYIDKDSIGHWNHFGFYHFDLPVGGDSMFILNAWHDTNTSHASQETTDAYEFRIKNETTGEIFDNLPTATKALTQGNINTGKTSTSISTGNPPGTISFSVFARQVVSFHQRYSTVARFKCFVFSRFR